MGNLSVGNKKKRDRRPTGAKESRWSRGEDEGWRYSRQRQATEKKKGSIRRKNRPGRDKLRKRERREDDPS
jgi:hypothetical protein